MPFLLAKDTVNGAEGSVVIERDGQNIVVAGMRNIKTTQPVGSVEKIYITISMDA